MDDPARIRRLYRLLVVLCGRPIAAGERLGSLPVRIPDGPRGERIAIQAARDMESGAMTILPSEIGRAIARLPQQDREVWVLRRVMGFSERDTAIAVDCSRTVVRRRLENLGDSLGPDEVAEVRSMMLRLGLPVGYLRHRRIERRGRRRLMQLAGVGVVLVAVDVLRRWLLAGPVGL